MMMMKVAKRLNCSTARLLRDPSETAAGNSKKRKRERERIIVHVDVDCFFASVALRDNPELRGKPIAVCHSGNAGNDPSSGAKGGEISSCSYEARAYGVKAGMFFKKAKGLCPELLAVPYDFDAYERVSVDLYFLFFGIDERVIVEAKSVDEAYLDLTGVVDSQAMSPSDDSVDALVGKLRQDIFNLTGCRASAGIGPSKLLARLGTSKAKPNGQWQVQAEDAPAFLLGFNVHELPGIGWKTRQRFKEMGVKSCEDLRSLCLDRLTAEFGPVSGRTFFDYCRGIDGEDVKPLAPRKSIGAELSWGVRFGVSDDDKVEVFISGVAAEVARRCESAQAVPSKVVMKVYRKKPDSGPPGKVRSQVLVILVSFS
jgi:DNA repair protein REV1